MRPGALPLISGSGDRPLDLEDGVRMARESGAPVAILADIPNQPLFGGLMEDALLAYTSVQFLRERWGDDVEAWMARQRRARSLNRPDSPVDSRTTRASSRPASPRSGTME
jgi:hypothetical protein